MERMTLIKRDGKRICMTDFNYNNYDNIDWQNNIGKKIEFEILDKSGEIEIIDYICKKETKNKKKIKCSNIKLKYNDVIIEVDKRDFENLIFLERFFYKSDFNLEKYIDLSMLKKNNQGEIDWKSNIGAKIPFKYYYITDYLELIDVEVKKQKTVLTIKYENNIKKIRTSSLSYLYILELINLSKAAYKYFRDRNSFYYDIGDVIEKNNKRIKIIDRYYKKKTKGKKWYKYECLECGYIGEILEYRLECNKGCPCCNGLVVAKGINDINTARPDIAALMLNEEDRYKYTSLSSNIVKFKCPKCGNIIEKPIFSVSYFGLRCDICGSKKSYGERFLYGILIQVDKNIIYDKSTEWSNNKRYDFISEKYNMIIEVHGRQHYEDCTDYFKHNRNRTIEDEIENDKEKRIMALQNGIKNYIEIDCKKSNFDYIKENVMKSELKDIIDLNKIDWNRVKNYLLENIYYKIIYDFSKEGLTYGEIIDKYQIKKGLLNRFINTAYRTSLITI